MIMAWFLGLKFFLDWIWIWIFGDGIIFYFHEDRNHESVFLPALEKVMDDRPTPRLFCE
jgi:hypothetical protein